MHDNSEQKGPTLDVGLGREHPLLLSRGWGGLKADYNASSTLSPPSALQAPPSPNVQLVSFGSQIQGFQLNFSEN